MYRVTTSIAAVLGGPHLSVFHFGAGGGMTAQNAANAAKAFWLSVDNLMLISSTWTVPTEVETVDPSTGFVTAVTAVTGGSGTGADAGQPLPPQSQMLVAWRTGTYINGREIRGRTYIPCLAESGNVAGVPEAAWITTLQTASDGLISDANSVFSVYSPSKLQEATVVTASVRSFWATQRRRAR